MIRGQMGSGSVEEGNMEEGNVEEGNMEEGNMEEGNIKCAHDVASSQMADVIRYEMTYTLLRRIVHSLPIFQDS